MILLAPFSWGLNGLLHVVACEFAHRANRRTLCRYELLTLFWELDQVSISELQTQLEQLQSLVRSDQE